MVLTVYTLEQTEQWDVIVRSFKQYDVYWLSGYVKAFYIHGDGDPLLFYYEDNTTRGINVVMKRDIANDEKFAITIPRGQYYDFSSPYGYGGWIIEGRQTKGLFDEYECWLKKNKIICEFVRFHPMVKNQDYCKDFYEIIQLGEVVHMELSSPEVIWNNIIGKNRNMIRKAIKNDVKIYNGRFPGVFKEFRRIYNSTMDKDGAEKYYYFKDAFYESVLSDLPHNAQLFWAEKDGQIIAASIILAANGRMNYHLSGSLRDFCSYAPTNLLLYEAALWGFANGYKTFYLGGGVGSGEDGLFRFKRAFYKGELSRFCIGKKIYLQEKYDELLGMRADIENQGFFPEYRG